MLVPYQDKNCIILNVYTPYECHHNEDEYLNRLSFISYFIEISTISSVYVIGDMNVDILDRNSLFSSHIVQFCQDNNPILSSEVLYLPRDAIMCSDINCKDANHHLKYGSKRIAPLLAVCFTSLLIHGVLPDSMLSVLLVPVIKNKAGMVGNLDNYRPIALASILSEVLEKILLDRLNVFINSTDEQFGFGCFASMR